MSASFSSNLSSFAFASETSARKASISVLAMIPVSATPNGAQEMAIIYAPLLRDGRFEFVEEVLVRVLDFVDVGLLLLEQTGDLGVFFS